ncbi:MULTISPECIES: tetratricopeptide repeat protein [Streptomyces]|uniref:Tetratricopeptide repeat protein n=1 Tax=Streptomyces mirabilis TaxID=68239 RepID=A0ABU3V4Z2_9ACTN|nr:MULTISPECIES: tetratricopeptide repeat protein [Streptomyces]MCX4617374.1 tetratricopeptide repeat protein [Streptomyces mirabilis]MCX5356374.1 tetratricopeptide repeat protein [Streptomyces mirabilis]MDU9000809.1 tetratricopeptide repeat protein [Streptomyces mirabilis]QDN84477.1 tetratricopeptide repeat protein [Streptomyces sp. RLB3-6]QDO05337.1 tetratricopeptide repeat protein [Streptomyces sp. S1D4-23]
MRGGTARTHRRGDYRDTLSSRNNLAGAYQPAGDLGRANPLYEQTLADRQRVLAEQAEFWLCEDEPGGRPRNTSAPR